MVDQNSPDLYSQKSGIQYRFWHVSSRRKQASHKNNQLNLITIYIGLVNARVTSDSPLSNRARLIVSKKKQITFPFE